MWIICFALYFFCWLVPVGVAWRVGGLLPAIAVGLLMAVALLVIFSLTRILTFTHNAEEEIEDCHSEERR